MLHVSNKRCIRNLAKKSFKKSKTRNVIAILAIALTTLLFSSLFTVAMSFNEAYQQSNFRMIGGYAHGGFKYLTEKQYLELKDDPLIKEYGTRRVVGMGTGENLRKNHVEVCWSDSNDAKWMWLNPIEGRLPKEGTNEAATDLEILRLLGVEPKLGETFTIPMEVDGKPTERTYTLCGWWEKDPIVIANMVLIPETEVNDILDDMDVSQPALDGMTGSWDLDVMLSNSRHIEKDLKHILNNHNFQSEDKSQEESYVDIGVNWGYTGAQFTEHADPMTIIAIAVLLILIIFAGYLIIYNVFQISVVNDIRFYGLLKTIGTTGRQIKSILRRQALKLCVIGIPVGCILGWLIGVKLSPFIMSRFNGLVIDTISVNPWIFIGSALFSLLTVYLSCVRPGRMAAKISPVEAVRYTEGNSHKKKQKKGKRTVSLFRMAWNNLGRSKGKTFITILSLTLSVVLLQTTVIFTNGFDMDKYLADKSVSDFILADAAYFQDNLRSWSAGESILEPRIIEEIKNHGGIKEGGLIYGQMADVVEYTPEDWVKQKMREWGNTEEEILSRCAYASHTKDGRILDSVKTYGMEPFILERLKVYDGDISKLNEPDNRYVAAVYSEGDYGEFFKNSHWAKVGDTVTLRYVSEWEIYNPETGEVYSSEEEAGDRPWDRRPLTYRDETFTVAAVVTIPNNLSYRYYGSDEFVMGADTFQKVNGTDDVMLYAFDAKNVAKMEQYLHQYTTKDEVRYDYESKASYQAEFKEFQSMFLMVGSLLAFIVGLVGVLNFINAILTGILTRKREFAMLQSIGMTGKQLKVMLVYEGLLYSLGSVVLAVALSLVTGPLTGAALGKMFWFFSYKPTVAPILIVTPIFALLGCVVPLLVYSHVSRQTIVERLRESEG